MTNSASLFYSSVTTLGGTTTSVVNYVGEGGVPHKDRALKVALTSSITGATTTAGNLSGHAAEVATAQQAVKYVDSLSDEQLASLIEMVEDKSVQLETYEVGKQLVKKA